MDMWSYLRNQRLKKSFVDLQFLSNYALFSKSWSKKLLKRSLEYESILCNYIIPLNYRLTGNQDQTMLYQERLSLRYNMILKLLSLFHLCF